VTIGTLRGSLANVFMQFGLNKVFVFGSYARGEETPNSDLDLLIVTDKRFDLEEYGRLEETLEEVTGKKVDIVFYEYVNPYMKDEILKEAVSIYE